MEEKTDLKVVKTEEEKAPGLSELEIKALEELNEEIIKMREEVRTKKYLSDIGEKHILMLKKFIEEDAPWKFTECLGIIEITKDITQSMKDNKKDQLFLTGTSFEAIYYYLSKVEGNGGKPECPSIPSVDDYVKILKSLTQIRNSIAQDTDKVKDLEFRITSLEQGIDPDKPEDSEKILAED